jgi:hypothetical protein
MGAFEELFPVLCWLSADMSHSVKTVQVMDHSGGHTVHISHWHHSCMQVTPPLTHVIRALPITSHSNSEPQVQLFYHQVFHYHENEHQKLTTPGKKLGE